MCLRHVIHVVCTLGNKILPEEKTSVRKPGVVEGIESGEEAVDTHLVSAVDALLVIGFELVEDGLLVGDALHQSVLGIVHGAVEVEAGGEERFLGLGGETDLI